MLEDKRILLGITGGIAAYKCAELVRLLRKEGASVRVVLTEGGAQFITAQTLQALSGHPVYQSLWEENTAMTHIELARWADLILIAPATANCLAKLAHGFADDLLTTICLASTAPLVLAPAMNKQMWQNSFTQENIEKLNKKNIQIFYPEDGEQACGEIGVGRLLEPQKLLENLLSLFLPPLLKGKNILVTAGSTQEMIDPVRYITNHSSGKMGYAIAEAARQSQANVTLISGPTNLVAHPEIFKIDVVTAQDMHRHVLENIERYDIFISTAAVCDYRVESPNPQKIKKSGENLNLSLTQNPDILKEVSRFKKRPFLVGFAAETEDLLENARKKLKDKNLDIIVANDVGKQKVFNADTNEVFIITPEETLKIEKTTKKNIAQKIIYAVIVNMEKFQKFTKKHAVVESQ